MFVFKLGHDRSPLINQFACTGDIHADRPGNRPRLRGGLGLISPCFLVAMILVAIFGSTGHDFKSGAGGVSIDQNHTRGVTASFRLPAGM